MAQGNAEMIGIAVAMAIDALTFLVSVVTLILMRWQGIQKPQVKASGNMLASIREGIKFLWRDDLLRTMFLLMVAANFLFAGPLLVGIPVLADSRLQGGAAAYGILMGAYGGGNLLGILMTNYVLKVIGRRMAAFIVGVIASFGVGLILMGVVGTTSVAFLILFTLGIGNGVLAITLITFIQRQSPKEMLGRVMSLVMLAAVGLVPVSQALTGMLIKMNLTGLFAVTGILMLLIAIWLAVQPVMRTIGQVLEAEVETAQL
jgi:MFS family permease